MLTEIGQLNSDLWLDQPDAHSRVDVRVASGSLSTADATLLRKFVDDGYLTTSIDLGAAVTDELDAEIGRLWQERPANVAVAVPGPEAATSLGDFQGAERQYGYRIPDLHGGSPTALSLYLQPEIFRLIDLIFDQQSVAFQSLYFEHGSTQSLHRDPMFAPTRPVPHLVAACDRARGHLPRERTTVLPARFAPPPLVRVPGELRRADTQDAGPASRSTRAGSRSCSAARRGSGSDSSAGGETS